MPGRIRLLLVDDHELVRLGLRSLLAAEPDIEIVAEAATGGQALARARQLLPDVVLLDARLPDMAGTEVCRLLCESLPRVNVAMLTTFTDDDLVRQSVRAGAQGYLLKDIQRLDLAENVRRLARGEPTVDTRVLPQVLTAARRTDSSASPDLPLNYRQLTLTRLVAEGFSNREIAQHMNLSTLTVKSYIEELLKLLGARNRVQAAILATRRGWL